MTAMGRGKIAELLKAVQAERCGADRSLRNNKPWCAGSLEAASAMLRESEEVWMAGLFFPHKQIDGQGKKKRYNIKQNPERMSDHKGRSEMRVARATEVGIC